MKRVLILGGTGDATTLAAKVSALPGVDAIASLAGRTREPRIPVGAVRIGGFGGVEGLTAYLRETQVDLLVDATHPFAAQISFNAAAAAALCDLPYLMLIRPAWEPVEADNTTTSCYDRWIEVESVEAAATILPGLAKRVFLTIGRQELAAFADLEDIWFLMRMIDSPEADRAIPPGKLLLERGPFSLLNEQELLRKYDIEAIVSKNSGGDATYAKIIAARELGIPVVMVQRPPMPVSEWVTNIESAIAWIEKSL